MAAVDYFLKIQGLDGESRTAPFAGGIDVESYSFGLSNTVSGSAGGGAGAGKVTLGDFTVVKRVDTASAGLLADCATGRHLPAVQLVSRRAPNAVYLQITLSDVFVTSFQEAGNQGELPLEQITFTYGKIEFEYAPLLPNGQLGTVISATAANNGKSL